MMMEMRMDKDDPNDAAAGPRENNRNCQISSSSSFSDVSRSFAQHQWLRGRCAENKRERERKEWPGYTSADVDMYTRRKERTMFYLTWRKIVKNTTTTKLKKRGWINGDWNEFFFIDFLFVVKGLKIPAKSHFNATVTHWRHHYQLLLHPLLL